MLKIIRSRHPEIYPLIWQAYSRGSDLHFSQDVIYSLGDVQQGDPLGSFVFSMCIQKLISNLKSELNIWYLDDGTLAGDPDTLISDFETILIEGEKLVLFLNPEKCELYALDPEDKFKGIAPKIMVVNAAELTMLGVPILVDAYNSVLNKKALELQRMIERVSDIDCHEAYYSLKNCLAIPKLLFFLRSAPLHESQNLPELDTILKNGLAKVLNIDFDERKWRQLTLPVKMGVFGIRSVTDIALPAFISSYHNSKEITDIILPTRIKEAPYLDESITEQLLIDIPGITNDDLPKDKFHQSNWDLPLCKLKLKSLISEAINDVDRARLIGISYPHASDWLEALPSATVGLKMENKQFRVVSALRLDANICQPHSCVCGKEVEGNGIYGLS